MEDRSEPTAPTQRTDDRNEPSGRSKERDEPTEHLDRLAHQVIGAAIEVHRYLGPGLPEAFYFKALAFELDARQIPFAHQVPLDLVYKGHPIGSCRLDLVVDNELVVELKAVEALAPVHKAQVLTYLKIGGFPLGLVINFNVPMLRDGIRRVVLSGWGA